MTVPPQLIRRLKSHFYHIPPPCGPTGVDVILGLNGYVWVSNGTSQERREGGEGFDSEGVYSNQNDVSRTVFPVRIGSDGYTRRKSLRKAERPFPSLLTSSRFLLAKMFLLLRLLSASHMHGRRKMCHLGQDHLIRRPRGRCSTRLLVWKFSNLLESCIVYLLSLALWYLLASISLTLPMASLHEYIVFLLKSRKGPK